MIKYGFYKHNEDVECIKYDTSLVDERREIPITEFYYQQGNRGLIYIGKFHKDSIYHADLITFDNFHQLQKYAYIRLSILIKE